MTEKNPAKNVEKTESVSRKPICAECKGKYVSSFHIISIVLYWIIEWHIVLLFVNQATGAYSRRGAAIITRRPPLCGAER